MQIKGTLNPRALCQMRLAFMPLIETVYKGTALLETEEGSFSIELIGKSEAPKITINKRKISFNNVKINNEKSEMLLISSKCTIPMNLNLNFTNDAFYSNEK